jgi:two-component system, NtrC family, sensor kinase
MGQARLFGRYRLLQSYVGWTDEDEGRIRLIAPLLRRHLPGLIDDFYDAIQQHPQVRSVITGGDAQIERLKGSLLGWVNDLLSALYDEEYVGRRWRVGRRHVEIGLDQIYTNAALSRLRNGLLRTLAEEWPRDDPGLMEASLSLTKLLDLDLAIIEDAYQDEASAKLQRTERLATMGQIAGGIAHELRNPLNVMKTSVYYLFNARHPTPEKRDEHLRRIERNVDVADGVITTLTSFARMPMPDIQSVSVEQCILDALEANELRPDIRAQVVCSGVLPPVLADLDQLRIVFGNLIRNARDAMPEGGRLSIEAMPIEDGVAVAVTDSGVGITPEGLKRITEPLYSTKARGLGLGLAIVRAILDKIQGHLGVTSEPGRGSRFTVTLRAATTSEEMES